MSSTLLVGGSKTGKTRFFSTFPRPSLHINLDPSGYRSLTGSVNVSTDLPTTVDDRTIYVVDLCVSQKVSPSNLTNISVLAEMAKRVIDIVNYLWDNQQKFKSVALDSLTGLQNPVKSHVLRWNNRQVAVYQDWGQAVDKIDEIVTALVALPINTLVTAHLQLERNELTGELLELPLVFGKQLPNKLMAQFDNIFLTRVVQGKDDKIEYFLRTKPTEMFRTAGSRIANLPTLIPPHFDCLTPHNGEKDN